MNASLASRTLSPELIEASKIIAEKDREIFQLRSIGTLASNVYMPDEIATEIFEAVSESVAKGQTIGFYLDIGGNEVIHVKRVGT